MERQEGLCPTGVRNETEINNLKENFETICKKIDLLFKEIKKIREEEMRRLPNWAAFVISSLMGLVGFLGAQCIHLLKP